VNKLKAFLGMAALLCVSFAGVISYKGYQEQRLHFGTTPVAQAFNAYLEQRAKANEFSGTVLMAKNGTPILEQGYGFANSQKNVPNTANTIYCIASVGKLFTAVAIGQLVEQGKLSFDAPIGKYISGFPSNVADNVTIGELLDMTGGFGNVAPVSSNKPITLADQMKLIYGEKLVSRPGVTFNYSNDGYIALGAIIQQVSGEPYATYIQQHIFTPTGMNNTSIAAYKPEDVANMAHGYTDQDEAGKWTDVSDTYEIGNPSGGAYSTAGDLLKFAQALTNHKLLSAATTNTILIPRVNTPQSGGPSVDAYTYGFAYQKENGVAFVGHNGGTPGYEDQLDIYPDKGYVVVVMTNQDNSMTPAIQESEKLLTQ
jgi:CubicO group peptidase (beta-lactamase class C family)